MVVFIWCVCILHTALGLCCLQQTLESYFLVTFWLGFFASSLSFFVKPKRMATLSGISLFSVVLLVVDAEKLCVLGLTKRVSQYSLGVVFMRKCQVAGEY